MSLLGTVLGHGLGQPPGRCLWGYIPRCWGTPAPPQRSCIPPGSGQEPTLLLPALLDSQAELCSGFAPATLGHKGQLGVKTSVRVPPDCNSLC